MESCSGVFFEVGVVTDEPGRVQRNSERPLSDPSPDVATTCTYGMPLVSEVLFGTLSGGAARGTGFRHVEQGRLAGATASGLACPALSKGAPQSQ